MTPASIRRLRPGTRVEFMTLPRDDDPREVVATVQRVRKLDEGHEATAVTHDGQAVYINPGNAARFERKGPRVGG